ncbi:MAG: hypothetical protein MZV64_60070 [Ignavibacteriales bacterium]|nr:hypothetical protein [Ignavibacteriales bacterium]
MVVFGAVVGDVLDDGEARSAVGAVDEGIAVAPVVGVEEFAQAVVADGDVGRDGLEGAVHGFRVDDVEGGESVCGAEGRRSVRRCGREAGLRRAARYDEGVQHILVAIHFDVHTRGGVAHPAVEFEARGKVVHERAEADPLDDAGDVDAAAVRCILVGLLRFAMSQSIQASRPSPVRAGDREGDDVRVEHLHAALEVIHAEGDVGQQVDLVDDQRVHAAIGAGIFVGFVVAFGDGGDEHGLVRAKFEVGGTDQVADVLDDEQVELRPGRVVRARRAA